MVTKISGRDAYLAELGQAFGQILNKLRRTPLNLFEKIARTAELPPDEFCEYLEDPDVLAALAVEAKRTEVLLRRGITPTTFAYAVRSVGSLLNLARDEGLLEGDEVILHSTLDIGTVSEGLVITRQRLVQEIEESAHLERDVAEALLDWIVELAKLEPRLFLSWQLEVREMEPARLQRLEEPVEDVVGVWRMCAVAAALLG